jgi:hypothetical protein
MEIRKYLVAKLISTFPTPFGFIFLKKTERKEKSPSPLSHREKKRAFGK